MPLFEKKPDSPSGTVTVTVDNVTTVIPDGEQVNVTDPDTVHYLLSGSAKSIRLVGGQDPWVPPRPSKYPVYSSGTANDGEALVFDVEHQEWSPSSVVSRDDFGVSPRQFGGVGDGTADDTDAVQAAADAAEGGRLILPAGTTWLVDPIALGSNTTVQLDGVIKLRGQNAANLPAAHGVLYAYGTAEAHLSNVSIIGTGLIDGNRRGMSNTDAFTLDQEGVNFKYVDGWFVSGIRITDTIDSGLDIDNSTGGHAQYVRAHACAGWGFHMSNGAIDNELLGCVATSNGAVNNRGGFDQYDWTSPQANRNRYIGCCAEGNQRNYRIGGAVAVMEGCTSIGGTFADEITADLTSAQAAPAVRPPSTAFASVVPATGDVVDVEARAALAELRATLQQLKIVRSGDTTPTAWASDTFARSTTGSLGSSSGGQAWTSDGFECNGSAAVRSTENFGAAHWSGIGTTNVRVVAEITTGAARTAAGVRGRATASGAGADYLVVDLVSVSGTNGVRLRKRQGGTSTDLVVNTDVTIEPSTTYTLDVAFVGDAVVVRLDGTPVIWHVLSAADLTSFGGRGFFGPYSSRTATQDDGTTRWESFALYRLDA